MQRAATPEAGNWQKNFLGMRQKQLVDEFDHLTRQREQAALANAPGRARTPRSKAEVRREANGSPKRRAKIVKTGGVKRLVIETEETKYAGRVRQQREVAAKEAADRQAVEDKESSLLWGGLQPTEAEATAVEKRTAKARRARRKAKKEREEAGQPELWDLEGKLVKLVGPQPGVWEVVVEAIVTEGIELKSGRIGLLEPGQLVIVTAFSPEPGLEALRLA